MHLRYRLKELERCTGCRRLMRRAVGRDGPEGGRYGPGCFEKALREEFAQAGEAKSSQTSAEDDPAVNKAGGTHGVQNDEGGDGEPPTREDQRP